MRSLSPLLSSLTAAFKPPIRPGIHNGRTPAAVLSLRASIQAQPQPHQSRQFTSTPTLAKKKVVAKPDKRITLIRYFLHHPKTPRPLRFSRTRYLRHWTIHRAWHLYQSQRRRAQTLDFQRQWQVMGAACEELRTGAGDGGKLFRVAMNKRGVYTDLIPIEYGRLQTEWPAWKGWDHEWTRPKKVFGSRR